MSFKIHTHPGHKTEKHAVYRRRFRV